MYKTMALVATMLVVAAALGACGSDSKKTVDLGDGNKAQVSTSSKLPDDFPDDFPIYGGAKVTSSNKVSADGKQVTQVVWDTDDGTDKVSAFYKNAFEKGPWKSSGTFEASGASSFVVQNEANNKGGTLTLAKADNGDTVISAVVGDGEDFGGGGSGDSLTTANRTATARAGDEGSGEEPTEDAGPAKTSTPSPLPAAVTLDKDFPKDRVPLPNDARVTSNSSFGQGGSKTFIITFYTKDSPEKVAEYFSAEMPKHGFSDAFSSNTDGEYFVTFTGASTADGGNEGLTVSASKDTETPGYTVVSLSLSIGAP